MRTLVLLALLACKAKAPPPAEMVSLEKGNGATLVYIIAKPRGAVWVDGVLKGEAPALRRVELMPGEHTIEVKADGFVTQKKTFRANGEHERELRFELEAGH